MEIMMPSPGYTWKTHYLPNNIYAGNQRDQRIVYPYR